MNPHGIALDSANRLALIAGEENHSLALFDLKTLKLLSVYQVGDDPDVLAFDPGLKRLYVSAESGTVSVLLETDHALRSIGQFDMPHAHTVSVDPNSHLVYFPLGKYRRLSDSPHYEANRPALTHQSSHSRGAAR
jgi:DNA-binding beta-propeller fold protein YncE